MGRIVYELDGELHVFDVVSRKDTYIPITVPDDGLNTRSSRYPASKNIEDFELSPKGERALFVARGDVFTAPDRARADAQPHRLLERARQVGAVVAGWREDRLHL